MLRSCLVALLIVWPMLARAEIPALCADAPNQTEGTLCAKRKLDEAGVRLARAYDTLEAKLDPLGKRNLALAETAWLRFRDLECNLESGYDADDLRRNGTIVPMLAGECAVTLTERRIQDLAGQLKCPGGDLSCEP